MDTRLPYPSDLTDRQWATLAPLVPDGAPGGRPLDYPRREIVNALLYVARTGCQWRLLPHDLPPWPTVYHYFQVWTADGTLARLHTALREHVRQRAGRDPQPTAAIVDSQTVKTAAQPGPRGYDGAKHTTGRKRHLLVDTMGLLLVVLVTAANVSDPAGARLLFRAAQPELPRLQHIWADSIYRGTLVEWALARCGGVVEIVRHLVPVHTFQLLKRRWVVERTFGWWGGYRRLSKDYEVQPAHSEGWIILAMCQIMLRRLAPATRKRPD